jgi:hypothetical protein
MKFTPFLLIFLFLACNKELKHSKEELYKTIVKADPTAALILPKSMSDGINCANYTNGCIGGHTIRVKGMEFIAVEFDNTKNAKTAAKKIKGYYTRNWVLDDITGEPILERFVVKQLEAKKP